VVPTLTEVAQRAGVSLSTASRAFSEPDRISREALDRVVQAADELGYVASSPRRGRGANRPTRSTTVAMVVPDLANPVIAQFVKAAQAHGWYRRQTLVLADSDGSPAREREVIGELQGRVDGFIACAPRLPAHDIRELCGAAPLVLFNRDSDEVPSVLTDAEHGLRQALEYLRVLGHEHVAYVQGSQYSWSNTQRVAAMRRLCEENDLALTLVPWQAESIAGGNAAAASVVASGATAVIGHNDLVAVGLVQGAAQLGLAVPDDLSVVGIDDTSMAQVATPALTSIQVPASRAGVLSIDMLHRAMSGEEPDETTPATVHLPTQLVVRQSTGPVSGWTPGGGR
jgi:LacI family transcriptional regulator